MDKHNQFVDGEGLLAALYPQEGSRPSLRWLYRLRMKRRIPYVKIGSYVWYEVEKVAAALRKTGEVQSRSGS